jgi:hypothetical protein
VFAPIRPKLVISPDSEPNKGGPEGETVDAVIG